MSREDVLVSADWAEKNLDAPGVVFVEVDEDTTAYDGGHIAGAVKLDWKTDLQDPVRRDFVDKAQFEALLSARGHRQRRHRRPLRRQQQLVRRVRVLVLQALRPPATSSCSTAAARSGSSTAAPLHRGRADRARPPSTRRRTRTPRSARSATRSSPRSASKNLVDVRSPDEFAGRLLAPAHLPQEQAQRAGHIPTALNVPWSQGGQRGRHLQVRRRAARALRRRRAGRRARTPSRTAGSASAPAHTWFVLHELLGQPNVKNYDGSWTEYGSLVGVPVENDG